MWCGDKNCSLLVLRGCTVNWTEEEGRECPASKLQQNYSHQNKKYKLVPKTQKLIQNYTSATSNLTAVSNSFRRFIPVIIALTDTFNTSQTCYKYSSLYSQLQHQEATPKSTIKNQFLSLHI